jgi:PAS domain S-box-containing protein
VDFFRSLVRTLSEICGVQTVFIGELDKEEQQRISSISIYSHGQIAENFSYDLRDTPCERVLNDSMCFYASDVQTAFPRDFLLTEMGVDSYLGIPLLGSKGQLLGIIVMLNDKPMPFPKEAESILSIIAARSGSELERAQTEELLRVSDDRHRIMLDQFPLGVGLLCDNQLLYANPMACHILGIASVKDLEATSPFELVVEADRERVRGLFMASAAPTAEPLPVYTTKIRRTDDQVLDVEFSVLKTQYGLRACVQVNFSDVTASRQTAEALHETQERFSLFMQHLSGLAWIKNLRGEYLYANAAALRVFQCSPEKLYGKTDTEVLPPETARPFIRNDQTVISSRSSLHTTETFRHPDGVLHYSLVNKFPIRNSRGEISLVGGLATDITELVQAENTIRKLNDFHQAIIQTASDGICVYVETSGFPYVRFTVWNDRMTELTGYTQAEINELGWYQSLYPDAEAQALAIQRMKEMRKQNDPRAEEREITRKDGQQRILTISTSRIEIEDGVQGIVGLMQDVTERRLAEAGLRQTTSLLEAVINGTSDAIFVKDLSGRYLLINEAAATLVGKTSAVLIGKDDTSLFDRKSAEVVMEGDRQIMRQGSSVTFEETATVDGVKRCFHATKGPYRNNAGEVIGLIGISRDITRQKLIEDQFHQAQKMEAIGQLAGGIAHDFNNLLTVITGYAEIILSELSSDHGLTEPLTLINEAGQRAAVLTAQLLAFSRKTIVEPKTLNLKRVIEHLGKMLRRLIGEHIVLNLDFSDKPCNVVADLGQTEQMLMNLYVNARDAMPNGGTLTISTRPIVLSSINARNLDLREGRYVRILVSDTGVGIAPEIQNRVFEPFFTTKATGSGTGLGLATVYGIVRQSGGSISLNSAVGIGTTFIVHLPAAESAESPPELSPQDFAPIGTETICFVEDEESVRRLIRLVLETQGYTVIAAASGAEALAQAADHVGNIDLLLTDVVMPGMNGRELVERFRRRWPLVHVLYMSGYTGDAVIRYGVETAADAFMQKPFTPLALARKIRQTLDRRG